MKSQGMLRGIWELLYPVLLYELISTAAAMLLFGFTGITDGNASLLVIVINALVITPVLFWIHRRDVRRWNESYSERCPVPIRVCSLVWVFFSSGILAIMGNILISLTPLLEMSDRFWETQEILTSGNIWLMLFSTIAAAPLLEEMLVRGVLYPRMRRLFGVKAGIILSALLFAVLHGNLVQGVYAFVLGAYFAWLMERFDNIWIPVLGHMSANLFVTFVC